MLSHSILPLLSFFVIGFSEPSVSPDRVDFERQVRPILTRSCFPCHGPEAATRKAELRLDRRSGLFSIGSDGLQIILPEKPDQSLLMQRLTDEFDPMPPEGHPELTEAEVAIVRQWIEEGAAYQGHWSWNPLEDPEFPKVDDEEWSLQALDNFILAGLEEQQLVPPAPPAAPHSWLRRVFYDLTGLPPTNSQIDAFLKDSSLAAREKIVDELLASQAHAEHFARHWLDLMRYAESHGHEFDYYAGPAFEYRDWVIDAIANDLPIDEFVTQQIAGDLLEGEARSNRATGWWWLSQATHGPVDVLADTLDRVDNQIDVISRAFLGATVSCARCHDHKFDAIGQSDWTALSGIVRSTRRVLHPIDEVGQIEQLTDQLDPVRERFREGIEQSIEFQKSLPLPELLSAAKDLHEGPQELAEDQRSDRLLWDFSSGWDGWTVTGDAFGATPHTRDELPEEFRDGLLGEHLATSHDRRPDENSGVSDRRQGQLVSDEFVIDREYLSFLIAGGRHPGEAYVQLIIDGEAVHEATGNNSTRLKEIRWDVAEYSGQSASLRVVDQHQGGWGHISCTDFRLTDEPPAGIPAGFRINEMARKRSLDKDVLRRWAKAYPALMKPAPGLGELPATSRILDDFSDGSTRWTLDGPAFEPISAGTWLLMGEPRLTSTAVLHSGASSRALVGTALSQSFVADQNFLHVVARGEDCQIRLSVEGYWMDQHNALLFEGLSKKVESLQQDQHLVFDLSYYQGRSVHIEVHDHGRGWVAVDRIWLSDDSSAAERSPDWSKAFIPDTGSEEMLTNALLLSRLVEQGLVDPSRWGGAWNAAVIKPVMDWKEIESQIPDPRWALACSDAPIGRDVSLQIRGDSKTPGELIPRTSLQLLSARGEWDSEIKGSGRLQLADLICDSENPLFWRVQANRIWGWVMGEGLAATPDDLGHMGVAPLQRDLLDFLASRLSQNPSRRDLIRELILSQTYAMDSQQPLQGFEERDPLNQYWHRSHPRTLPAEAIRDGILLVSGKLDPTRGGPPIPIHLTEFLTGRGRPGQSGPVDGRGRRTIYLAVNRNFLDPFLTVFDFPLPSTTVGKRDRSNLPAQALALMNSPFVHEQAEHWGAQLHRQVEEDGADATLTLAWKQALGRSPQEDELQEMRRFVADGTLESWVDLAHVLFQSKEFRFVR
ncbi:MAG: hypothetical protein CBC13_09670 [Planctomycetia bacterium TMED53]|nr:MAG: hypothetical protein CBC13_09670 [Planctomycetia bacterium TMED53]